MLLRLGSRELVFQSVILGTQGVAEGNHFSDSAFKGKEFIQHDADYRFKKPIWSRLKRC